MASSMLSVMHKTRASLEAERTARAQGAARAARGYFAARVACDFVVHSSFEIGVWHRGCGCAQA